MNFPRAFRRVALLGAALCASALIASCGGGDQVDQFQPGRIISFGDETNMIDTTASGAAPNNGRSYGVNYLPPGATQTACGVYPTWNQQLANRYGLPFAECSGGPSRIYASRTQRRATNVAAQIDAFLASADGPFRSNDLITVHAGAADIAEASSQAEAEAAGAALGAQINRISATGARVLFLTVHRLNETPWGRASGRASTLEVYTREFNRVLRSSVVNNGRKIGMYDVDGLYLHEIVRYIANDDRGGFTDNFVNVTTPICTSANPVSTTPDAPSTNCTTAAGQLISDPNRDVTQTYLFADNLRLTPGANLRIGDRAYDRVRNLPF